ncbi:cache domain-containing protein [Azospirillum picis]|uniref:Signal transduction histidine kinase n=1 Tax=Azospirillum picis TaxID=488438 RepID=A0ABU0MPZ1_9PROT|nr:cache domain-containing protein [Azospirillum picis]MBP2301639.1 signal transduction histidine kinase [Azospirillum picis]MDQ0535538.1 signal transduction histidine kinase [Azospirillum picis]
MRSWFRLLAAGLVTVGIAVSIPAVSTSSVAQDAKPTREEAKSVTLKAADLITQKGLEEAAKAFNAEGPFKHGELYVNVIDFAGVWKVYPPRPAGVGQSVINVKDPDGRFVVQDVLAVAKDKGEGWVEYRWLNPASNKIEPKVSYVKRIPGQDLVAYVGIYR